MTDATVLAFSAAEMAALILLVRQYFAEAKKDCKEQAEKIMVCLSLVKTPGVESQPTKKRNDQYAASHKSWQQFRKELEKKSMEESEDA